ncbi:deoxynucleoside kinase [Halalkalibacter nanhaiisediminis]|uniref:Deoxyguanosine kinase n=1 Tax=Halalkalibacter nanhaiisediminis TaxID=688079 RepID=A0A562QJG7_9BACI|nr:deoxynucleoside kinase [Halalkalibacter nanhaiisediminis]TWI56881.1 deoxyguanosine kinase [Halalkalibacter nanhaiisediminis]
MKNTPFIAVEGPIGVGKTSLAKAISTHYQYHLLKEIVDENPFLSKFYKNIEEWSFQTEMFFLCNRYKQLEDIQLHYLQAHNSVVADYHIYKNMIFAGRTLTASQYDKYKRIYDILTVDMPKPNLLIYLHASLPTLLKRIKLRGREMEQQIDHNYLKQLSDDYELAMAKWAELYPETPIIQINGDELNFVQNEEDLQVIFDKIDSELNKRSDTD